MVKCTNGIDEITVPNGAYESIFKDMGFRKIDEVIEEEVVNENENMNADNGKMSEEEDNAKFIEELMEKPISEWNKEEVKRFAHLNEIDISGTKNPGEAKDIIREYLNAN